MKRKIIEPPTLLESFSFTFHFSSCIIGPSLEFKDFIKFIRLQDEYENIDFSFVLNRFSKEFGISFIYMTTNLFLTQYFSARFMTTQEFGDYNFFIKLVYMYISGIVLRSLYYTGWKLSHSTMMFSGITYDKKINKDGVEEKSVEKAKNFDFYGVEIEPNPKKKITVSIKFNKLFNRNGILLYIYG